MKRAVVDSSNYSNQYIETQLSDYDGDKAAQEIAEAEAELARVSNPDVDPGNSYVTSVERGEQYTVVTRLYRNSAGGYGGSRETEQYTYYQA